MRTRYDTVLLPFTSIVRCPGRPVIPVPGWVRAMHFPKEKCTFLQKNVLSCRNMRFNAKNAFSCRKMRFFGGGTWLETAGNSRRVSGLKNQERWPTFTRGGWVSGILLISDAGSSPSQRMPQCCCWWRSWPMLQIPTTPLSPANLCIAATPLEGRVWAAPGPSVTAKFLGLPPKQNIGANQFWFEKVKLERNADKFGRDFLRVGLKPWKNKAKTFAVKIRHQISLRNSPAIFLKFARPK